MKVQEIFLRRFQVSLEASNLEISSLKTRLIEADSLVAEAEGKAERNATKAIEREFEAAQETLIAEREALAAALEDLRVHASRQGNMQESLLCILPVLSLNGFVKALLKISVVGPSLEASDAHFLSMNPFIDPIILIFRDVC